MTLSWEGLEKKMKKLERRKKSLTLKTTTLRKHLEEESQN